MKNTENLAMKCYKSNNSILLAANMAGCIMESQTFMGNDWAVFDSAYWLLNDAIHANEKCVDEVCEAWDKQERGPWVQSLISCIDSARDVADDMVTYADEHGHEILR